MKTAKINREEVRESTITVMVTEGEKKSVQKAADEMGITMSAFTRFVLKEFLKNCKN